MGILNTLYCRLRFVLIMLIMLIMLIVLTVYSLRIWPWS